MVLKKLSFRNTLLIGLLFGLVLTSIIFVYYFNISAIGNITCSTDACTSTTTTSLTTSAFVTVFGLTSTTGQGTRHTSINFTSSSGQNYVAPVVDNHFSIQLPNPGTYNVSTQWIGAYMWQRGIISRGQLHVNVAPGSKSSFSYNIQDDTPNSLLNFTGFVQTVSNNTHIIIIQFIATNDLRIDATIRNGNFSTQLPNLIQYTIQAEWETSDGTTGWCNASSLGVQAGPRIYAQSFDMIC